MNPFTPGFGSQPPILIGRDEILIDVRDGIREGVGSPLRALKVTGPRGSGKTTVLGAAADIALEEGWIPLSVAASPEMHEELLSLARDRTKHLRHHPKRKITGIEAGGFGVTLEAGKADSADAGWRVEIEKILDLLEPRGSGLLFIIDEVSDRHAALQTFGKRFQNLRSEQRNVSLIVAGLPLNVSEFESLKDTTFIRRSEPHEIANVPIPLVRDALQQTFAENGKTVDPKALRFAADATEGYPFLIQLVGYHIWRAASGDTITLEEAKLGVEKARRSIGSTVHSSAMADLSVADKTFLVKMALDDGPAKMSDITERAGWSPAQSGVYRSRLIKAGMIKPGGKQGFVDFAYPALREYLREHAATLVWTGNRGE